MGHTLSVTHTQMRSMKKPDFFDHYTLAVLTQVKAVIQNHGSPTPDNVVKAIKKPVMINGSDNDASISKDRLAEIEAILDSMTDVPSDVKV